MGQIKGKVESMSNLEIGVQLIVIRNNTVVEYGEITRSVLDITSLFNDEWKIKKLTREDCTKF
ncbi:MAG: hypothetical protein EOO43_24160 [Flavobacterium sp.]|nr:MAG: hypothetical protein EOO43_24160 [Flavobacterium sp.]